MCENKPWIEKYRPTKFEDIVLDDINKKILQNIISKKYFPNLLFYGPPGTGKTTTILNLINKFQENESHANKSLTIHLNASDDRGIDIIRNQITQFVNTKTLFAKGVKFVILDEVDYMTTNAQQALRYLIQQYTNNVKFCLICNYISRIDNALKNEFIKLRFSQLPKKKITKFLKNIIEKENISFTSKKLKDIQLLFNSDIRSMINYIQTNHSNDIDEKIIPDKYWCKMLGYIKNKDKNDILNKMLHDCRYYNIEQKKYIFNFINYIIIKCNNNINSNFLDSVTFIIHSKNNNIDYILGYFIYLIQSEHSNLYNNNSSCVAIS
jgi:replication factor C subunit 3/5